MYVDYCFDYSHMVILQVTPAFFNDIHFYGQSSRKRSLENAASSSTSKRVTSKSNSSSTSTSTNGNSTSNTTSIIGSSINSTGSNTSSSGSSVSCAENSTSNAGSSTSSARSSTSSAGSSTSSEKPLLEPSNEEQEKFFATLNQASVTPAILRIMLPYAKDHAPKITLPSFPKPISELYDPATLMLTYPELLTECERVYGLYKVC